MSRPLSGRRGEAMTSLFSLVSRRRAGFLVCVLLAASLLAVWLQIFEGPLWPPAVLTLVLLVLAASASRGYRPAVLVSRPAIPAFETPVNPYFTLAAAGFTVIGVLYLSEALRDAWSGWPDAALTAGWVVLAIVNWYQALHAGGPAQLRVDGVRTPRWFGSAFIPWDSVEPGSFDSSRIVRLTGLDPAFLDRVVREYAEHPERRSAIATQAELVRLQEAVSGD